SGHATVAPLRMVMKSRRLTRPSHHTMTAIRISDLAQGARAIAASQLVDAEEKRGRAAGPRGGSGRRGHRRGTPPQKKTPAATPHRGRRALYEGGGARMSRVERLWYSRAS